MNWPWSNGVKWIGNRHETCGLSCFITGLPMSSQHTDFTTLHPFYSEVEKVHSPNLFEEKCIISDVGRIASMIIFHLSKWWRGCRGNLKLITRVYMKGLTMEIQENVTSGMINYWKFSNTTVTEDEQYPHSHIPSTKFFLPLQYIKMVKFVSQSYTNQERTSMGTRKLQSAGSLCTQ